MQLAIEPCTVANNMYGIENVRAAKHWATFELYTRQKKSSTKVFTTQSRMYQYRAWPIQSVGAPAPRIYTVDIQGDPPAVYWPLSYSAPF